MTELDDLTKKIEKAKAQRQSSPENLQKKIEDADNNMSLATKLAVELIAGLLVGGVLGYFLDQVFHTKPIMLIVLMILGAVASFWNIYKLAIKEESDK